MATYDEAKIINALNTRLAALVLSPVLQIAWPSVAFNPKDYVEDGYLEVTHLPSSTEQITLGDSGYNRHGGIYQVSVMWPENGGEVTAKERGGAVAAHFKRGTVITLDSVTVRIIKPPYVSGAIHEPPFSKYPVTIEYFADIDNPA